MSVLKVKPIILLSVIAILGASVVNGNPCIDRFCKHVITNKEISEKLKAKKPSEEWFFQHSDFQKVEEAFNTGLAKEADNSFNKYQKKYNLGDLMTNGSGEEELATFQVTTNIFHIISLGLHTLKKNTTGFNMRSYQLIHTYFEKVSQYCHKKQTTGNEHFF